MDDLKGRNRIFGRRRGEENTRNPETHLHIQEDGEGVAPGGIETEVVYRGDREDDGRGYPEVDTDAWWDLLQEREGRAQAFWSPLYRIALDAMAFAEGDQWHPEDEEERNQESQPVLTINMVKPFVESMIGELVEKNHRVRFLDEDQTSADEFVTQEGKRMTQGEILEGLLRRAERRCGARWHYQRWIRQCIQGGVSWLRVYPGRSRTGRRELKIESVKDPSRVYSDPSATDPALDDIQWAFVYSPISRAEAIRRWGTIDSGEETGVGPGARPPVGRAWMQDRGAGNDQVAVCEYYWIEKKPVWEWRTPEGQTEVTGDPDALPDWPEDMLMSATSEKFDRDLVFWAKVVRQRVVEHALLGVKEVPLVPMLGYEKDFVNEDGMKGVGWVGAVDALRGSQIELNTLRSDMADRSKNAQSRILASTTQIEGFEQYDNLRMDQNRVLPYHGDANTPPPYVVEIGSITPAQQALLQMITEEFNGVSGLTRANMGHRSNERSGRAISERKEEGIKATHRFGESLEAAFMKLGRLALGLIPVIYGGRRMLTVTDADGSLLHLAAALASRSPLEIQTDAWEVEVAVTGSAENKREEVRESLLFLMQTDPNVTSILLDQLIKVMDLPDADAVSMRILNALPEHMKTDDERREIARHFGEVPPDPAQQAAAEQQEADIENTQADTELKGAQAEKAAAEAAAAGERGAAD